MFVVKRDGRRELVHFDKVTARISKLCYGLNSDFVDAARVCQKVRPSLPSCFSLSQVVSGIYSGVTTVELDNLAAETAAYLTTHHPDYAILVRHCSF